MLLLSKCPYVLPRVDKYLPLFYTNIFKLLFFFQISSIKSSSIICQLNPPAVLFLSFIHADILPLLIFDFLLASIIESYLFIILPSFNYIIFLKLFFNKILADDDGYINHFHKNSQFNLCILCKTCHEKIHNNDLQLDTINTCVIDIKDNATKK